MKHKGCRHLVYDFRGLDPRLKLCSLENAGFADVWFWNRSEIVKELQGFLSEPRDVQYCLLRGRINGIFQCINSGELPCFEAQEEEK